MIKYVRHVTTMKVIIVFCLIISSQARSAAVSTYQHLNGITIKSDGLIHEWDSNNRLHEPSERSPNHSDSGGGSSGIWKDLTLIYRIYQQCAKENLSTCLKVKLLTGLERILRKPKTLRIIEGIQFVRSGIADSEISRSSTKELTEQEIDATLPRNLEAKEQVLNNLIFKKVSNFLRDHTLQVKFPDIRSLDQLSGNSIESRSKKNKKGGGAYIMIPLLLGGTFVPIAYGALAMLAGKALIVSKLALVLASIIGIKKLLGGGGGKESHEVVVSSSGHSGWGRDMDLAYSGWKSAKGSEKLI